MAAVLGEDGCGAERARALAREGAKGGKLSAVSSGAGGAGAGVGGDTQAEPVAVGWAGEEGVPEGFFIC